MNLYKKIVTTLLALVTPMLVIAQDYDIELDSYYGGNYVLLRWYPQSFEVYKRCSEHGFVVERRSSESEQWQTLSTLKPGSYADFSELEKKNDKAFLANFLLHTDETLKNIKVDENTIDNQNDENDAKETDLKNPKDADFMYKMCLLECEFSVDMAKVMALNFRDDYVHTQQVYEYRVRPADANIKLKCRTKKVTTNKKQTLATMANITAQNKDFRVYFTWNMDNLSADYSGFQLERSSDGTNFTRVNKEPIVHLASDEISENVLTCKDTLPDCDKMYYYRVCGLNRFGLKGPYSNVVKVSYDCNYTVKVTLKDVNINEKNEATLSWEVENTDNQSIKGFDIQRAATIDINGGQFESILKGKQLPSNTRTFIDKHPLESNYYRVVAYGKKEKQFSSSNFYYAHAIDSVPPAAPTGLKATIDSAGIVKLTWDKNTEPDIMAYRVFFSNDSLSEYIGASDTFLTTQFYTDTLNLGTLTNEIYYKVLAIDKNFNQGPLSAAVKLIKPDTIPPSPALFIEIKQDETGIVLVSWQKSSSTDVAKQVLLRKVGDEGTYRVAETWTGNANIPTTYADTFMAVGERIYYKLIVFDKSENKTEREAAPFKSKYIKRECVKNVTTKVNYKKGYIELHWDKCGCKISKINIYRSDADSDSKLMGTIKGVENTFFDYSVKKGERYLYFVQPVTEKMSKIVKTEAVNF